MQATAVGWQIYERLGSKLALAYVGLVQILPILFLAVPFGHLSDRFNRKYIVMAGQGLFLLSSLGLAAVSHTQGDPHLIYIFLFLLAIARSLTMPAMGAMLPTLIPKASWASAATWNSSVFELTGMVGPAVAGLVIAASRGPPRFT
jgi:MFS family permease